MHLKLQHPDPSPTLSHDCAGHPFSSPIYPTLIRSLSDRLPFTNRITNGK